MTEEEILKRAKWNKDTSHIDQLTFVGDDGFIISVVRSQEGMSRKEVERTLVERVQARYE